MARIKIDLGKPAIRMLRANMSTRAVTTITKRYADDHLFDWTKMAWCQTEGRQDIVIE